MSERPEATHHDPVQQPDSWVTDAVTPEPGAADPVDQSAGAEPSNTQAVIDPNGAGAASPAEAAIRAAADSTGPATGSTTDTAVDDTPTPGWPPSDSRTCSGSRPTSTTNDASTATGPGQERSTMLDTLSSTTSTPPGHGALTDGPFAGDRRELETSLGVGLEAWCARETFDPPPRSPHARRGTGRSPPGPAGDDDRRSSSRIPAGGGLRPPRSVATVTRPFS